MLSEIDPLIGPEGRWLRPQAGKTRVIAIDGRSGAGKSSLAARLRAELDALGGAPGANFARAIAGLPSDTPDVTFAALFRAADERDAFVIMLPLRVSWYDGIRGDPRFVEVVTGERVLDKIVARGHALDPFHLGRARSPSDSRVVDEDCHQVRLGGSRGNWSEPRPLVSIRKYHERRRALH